jgi:hypothetical protein
VLILARASQDAVVTALAGADADVGPTSAAGLTAVWCTGDEPIRALTGHADLVAVWDEPDEAHVVLHLSHEGREQDRVWPLGRTGALTPPAASSLEDLTDDLCRFFAVPAQDGLVPALAVVRQAEHLTDLLEGHFDLPDLDPVHRRAVTAHRGRPSDARIAGRLAARGGSDVEVTPAGDGWTVLDAGDPAVQQVVSLAVGAAGRRRDVVLHLWRGDGSAAGFELVHRDHVVAHGSWDDGWRRHADDDWQVRDESAEMLARRFGDDVDLPALRALLRARTRTGDPLARLVELLGVPRAVLDALDGTGTATEVTALQPAGPWRAVWEESRAESGTRFPLVGPRWLQVATTAVAGVLSLGLLVLGVVVVATDGAFLEQAGVTTGDWLFLGVATVCTGFSAWGAYELVRRGQVP